MARQLGIFFRLAPAILILLGGCSPGTVIDRIPTELGGLPGSAPARPQETSPYPAIHEIRPVRPHATMSPEEQLRLQRELDTARGRLNALQDPNGMSRAQVEQEKSEIARAQAKEAARTKRQRPVPR